MNLRERRYADSEFDFRSASRGPGKIRGYGAVFNLKSADLNGGNPKRCELYEVIAPGAFDAVLNSDVCIFFNHDENLIVGRTGSGTAKIGVDRIGLWYEVSLPDTQLGRDLEELIRRRDISKSSFSFTVDEQYGQSFQEIGPNAILRTIKKVKGLYDCSPVVMPAYPDTSVALAGMKDGRGLSLDVQAAAAAREREIQLAEASL